MQFLVHIDVSLPPDMPSSQAAELRARENAQSGDNLAASTMRRIWRVVGTTSSISIWNTDTLEALHKSLSDLPMFPYMKITVTPLIAHPSEVSYVEHRGPLPAF